MKIILTVLILTFILSSCKNGTEKDHRDEETFVEEENIKAENDQKLEKQTNSSINQKDTSGLNSPKEESNSENTSVTSMAGNYIKVDQESDSNCSCYCVDVNFNANSEICLTPDKMYINVRFQKIDENLVHVFLIAPSDINTEGDKIPWEKFDRNIPIAAITPKSTGEIDLDWLGFTINGDLAQNYALFGKKSLEGSYKTR